VLVGAGTSAVVLVEDVALPDVMDELVVGGCLPLIRVTEVVEELSSSVALGAIDPRDPRDPLGKTLDANVIVDVTEVGRGGGVVVGIFLVPVNIMSPLSVDDDDDELVSLSAA